MKLSSQVIMRVLSQFGPLVSASRSPAASSHSFCCSAHDAGERKEDYAANDATAAAVTVGVERECEGDERGINQSHLQQFVREAGKVVVVIKCSLRSVDSLRKGCALAICKNNLVRSSIFMCCTPTQSSLTNILS